MPKIAEIKVVNEEVWCRVILNRSTDVLATITLWSPDEIKEHDRSLLLDFVRNQVENYLEGKQCQD